VAALHAASPRQGRTPELLACLHALHMHTQATRHAEFEAIDRILADHGGDVTKAAFNRCAGWLAVAQ
jgi:hypothetical protein